MHLAGFPLEFMFHRPRCVLLFYLRAIIQHHPAAPAYLQIARLATVIRTFVHRMRWSDTQEAADGFLNRSRAYIACCVLPMAMRDMRSFFSSFSSYLQRTKGRNCMKSTQILLYPKRNDMAGSASKREHCQWLKWKDRQIAESKVE